MKTMRFLHLADLHFGKSLHGVSLLDSGDQPRWAEELLRLLRGKVSAFTGNSGVGKSSILNALDPSYHLKVGEVSAALGRGRHTTRHVELYRLACGAEIMDTPGFSSFDAESLDLELKHHLSETFPDFAPYIGQCRFHDCAHLKESGCAVTDALGAGKIPQSRYDSYSRLYAESAELEKKY